MIATFPSETLHKSHGATFDEIDSLLLEIEQGLRADDATNFEKLTIARRYGPLLLQLKTLVPHGSFKKCLMDRFPRNSYSKCNRWMVIAKHDKKVDEALSTHPDVAWGPKKMFDFLKGMWSPERDHDEDDSPDDLEEPNGSPSVIEEINENSGVEGTNNQEEHAGDRSRWEEMAANAESEAALIGVAPVTSSNEGILTVTVFSQKDHEVIRDGLSRWNPDSIPVYGREGVTNLTVSVSPQHIPEILLKLGRTLKSTLPSQLNVSVEL